jgi:hypothetical protein
MNNPISHHRPVTPESVRAQILAAFRDVPMPSVDNIIGLAIYDKHAPWVGDHKESQFIQSVLAGRHFREVDTSLLGDVYEETENREQIIANIAAFAEQDPFLSRAIPSDARDRMFQDISTHTLTERWKYFHYLSAEAYHYYLQVGLLWALDNMDKEEELRAFLYDAMHPYDFDYFYYGKDPNFEYLTSLFTASQFEAICSFLELFLSADQPYLANASAKLLRRGWGRVAHPAIEASIPFDIDRVQFHYPPASDPEVADLIEHIQVAFAQTPYPGDFNIVPMPSPSHYGDDEPLAYGMTFRGQNWRTIDPQVIADYPIAPCILTREASRYFLPAYMIVALHDDPTVADISQGHHAIYYLTHGLFPPDEDIECYRGWIDKNLSEEAKLEAMTEMRDSSNREEREYQEKRMAVFTKQERQAIIAYFKYCVKYAAWSYVNVDEVNGALHSYWIKSQKYVPFHPKFHKYED